MIGSLFIHMLVNKDYLWAIPPLIVLSLIVQAGYSTYKLYRSDVLPVHVNALRYSKPATYQCVQKNLTALRALSPEELEAYRTQVLAERKASGNAQSSADANPAEFQAITWKEIRACNQNPRMLLLQKNVPATSTTPEALDPKGAWKEKYLVKWVIT